MPLVLAIDQSTSATKALLFDADGKRLDRESLEHRQHYPKSGWVEHDAEEIWQNLLSVTQTLLQRNSAASRNLACLSISNQRETIVVFDRASGQPLYPAIVWQCRRSVDLCTELASAGHGDLIHTRTGLRLDAYFSGSKLLWLVKNQPGLSAQLASGEALIGTIDTYLIYRLTAGKVFATDPTNASRTLLYDIDRLCWDPELCSLFGVPLESLPEVRESESSFGETWLGGVLENPLPIFGVMGDSQAALFAQRCFEPGNAKVTLGSGSSVLMNIGEHFRLSEQGMVTALAWVRNGVPVYAFEGIIIHSAASLSWLQSQLGMFRDVTELIELANELDDSGGVYLVPAFSGLGLPHWSPDARAAIVGLSGHSDRRHVGKAALEAIAYQLRDALDAMLSESGVSLQVLHADGGPTANARLMQFTADICESALAVFETSECSALGASMMGLLGVGFYTSLADFKQPRSEEKFYFPAMATADVRHRLAGWHRAVKHVVASAE